MTELASKKCVPCHGGVPPVEGEKMEEYLEELPEWQVVEVDGVRHLERTYDFKNFRDALDFTNRVGGIAEKENHHPALLTEWGKVTVSWWTHAIEDLHRNDFIMAARTDQLYQVE